MTYDEQKTAVAEAVQQFPGEFGLRAFPGDVFRVSPTNSYYSDHEHVVLLYTQVKRGDKWLDFAKGTIAELRRERITL
jgi:hypothetical protein